MKDKQPGLLQKILLSVARFVHAYPGLIIVAAILLTVASAGVAYSRFKVVNNIGDLLNEKSAVNRDYLAYKKEFGVDEEYVVVIQSDDILLNRKVADEVAAGLNQIKPGISKLFYKLDFSKLEKRFLLFESVDDLKKIEDEVKSYSSALSQKNVKLDLNSMLDQANSSFDDKYLRQESNWKDFEPFINRFAGMLNDLADQIENKPKATPPPAPATADSSTPAESSDLQGADLDQLIAEHEYAASFQGGKTLLILATPGQREKDSASPYTKTLKDIRSLLAQMSQKYPQVKFGLTGEPVLDDDEMQTATKDTIQASIITLVLITLLFAVSYQQRSRPVYAIIVLLMALTWSIACTMLTVGHLNIISEAFVPMVLGLGIDFGIQILGRYEEELASGKSILNSLEETLSQTGLAVITGGTTTAVAFFTMCFNDFIGLYELGVICGCSVLLCLVANIVVLPAVFAWRDKRRSAEALRVPPKPALIFFGPGLNERWVSHPRLMIGLGAIFTMIAILGIPRVHFDYNLLNLQNPKLESVQVEHALFNAAGSSSIYGSITVDNIDQVRQTTAELLKLPSVKEVQSIADVMPQDQDQKLVIIKRIVHSLRNVKLDTDVSSQVDVARARQNIATLLQQAQDGAKQASHYVSIAKMAREAVATFDKIIPPLERAETAMQGLSQEELGRRLNRYQVETFGSMQKNLAWLKNQQTDRGITYDDIPPELRDRFIGKSGKLLIQVYAKGDIWERAPLVKFVDEVRTIDPHFTGTPTQNYAYIDLLRTSYQKAAGWAFLAIFILISLHFKTPRYIFLGILPLVLAVIWTLGIMGLAGIKFNPANIMTLPMVIGIGVAFGVYTTDRFREEGRMELFSNSTGKAVVLSAFCTIFGFASMLGSAYRGLYSLGLVMTLGVGMCLVASIIFLPQIFKLMTHKETASPSFRKEEEVVDVNRS